MSEKTANYIAIKKNVAVYYSRFFLKKNFLKQILNNVIGVCTLQEKKTDSERQRRSPHILVTYHHLIYLSQTLKRKMLTLLFRI